MSVLLRHVDRGLEHEDGEGDARDPANKAKDVKDGEKKENDASGPVFAGQHVQSGHEAEYDVEDAGDPDELFRELPGQPHVRIAEHRCNREDEGE